MSSHDFLAALENVTMMTSDFLPNTTAAPNASMVTSLPANQAPSSGGSGGGAVRYLPWDHPENILSKDVADQIMDVINCGFIPPIGILGIVGNLMSLVVLGMQGIYDPVNVILAGLALSDTGYVACILVRKLSCIAKRLDAFVGRNYELMMYPTVVPMDIMFGRITGIITMVIAINRCIAVLLPLKARILLTSQRMAIAVAVVYVIVIAMIGPMYVTGEIDWRPDPLTNRSKAYYVLTQFYLENFASLNIYYNIFLNIVLRYIPIVVVTGCTVAVLVRMRRMRMWRDQTSSSSKVKGEGDDKDARVTRMFLALCTIYIICNTFGLLMVVATQIEPKFHINKENHNLFQVCSAFNILLEATNSSINFIIYMALNQKFADQYRKLCGCKPSATARTSGSGKSSNVMTKTTAAEPSVSVSASAPAVEKEDSSVANES